MAVKRQRMEESPDMWVLMVGKQIYHERCAQCNPWDLQCSAECPRNAQRSSPIFIHNLTTDNENQLVGDEGLKMFKMEHVRYFKVFSEFRFEQALSNLNLTDMQDAPSGLSVGTYMQCVEINLTLLMQRLRCLCTECNIFPEAIIEIIVFYIICCTKEDYDKLPYNMHRDAMKIMFRDSNIVCIEKNFGLIGNPFQ
jgi:hypothetical protein